MSLLKLPEMFGGFIEKALPMKRKAIKAAGPIVEKISKIPMPKEAVFSDLERLMNKLDRLQELMLQKHEIKGLSILQEASSLYGERNGNRNGKTGGRRADHRIHIITINGK